MKNDIDHILVRRVRGAEDPGFAPICDLWHRIWYAHSEAEAHRRYRTDLLFGAWGRDQAHIHILEQGGKVLSGLVVFHLRARLQGRARRVAGIAMVATDPSARGRGLAKHLLDAVHSELRGEDPELGLLFSDIDPAYYSRMGYETWPMHKHEARLPDAGGRGYLVREVQDEDLGLLVDLHGEFTAPWEFAIERDTLYWKHLLGRERGRMSIAPVPPPRSARWLVTQGSHAVAHAAITALPDRLVLEDAAWLPGHAGAVRTVMTSEGARHGVGMVQVTASRAMFESLELVSISAEPLEKMMLTWLDSREHPSPGPRSHPLLRTDWF